MLLIALCFMFFKVKYIQSGSMEPTLEVGAIVLVNPHQTPDVGDIAMYRSANGSYSIIHRVVDVNDNGEYIFKGDNVNHNDLKPVTPSQIQGTVVYKGNWFKPIYHIIRKEG